MSDHEPPILLGVADRALRRWPFVDLMGVSHLAVLPLYPSPTHHLALLLAAPRNWLEGSRPDTTITARPVASGTAEGSITLNWDSAGRQEIPPSAEARIAVESARPIRSGLDKSELGAVFVHDASHALMVIPFPSFVVHEPSPVDVIWSEAGGESKKIGQVLFAFQPASPISPAERRALLSRPGQTREICTKLGCIKCGDELLLFDRLDLNDSSPPKAHSSAIHITNAPDVWACSCGQVRQETKYIRDGLPHFLRRGNVSDRDGVKELGPLYQHRRLHGVMDAYERLIEDEPSEEVVQQFLTENTMFFSFLSPTRILPKPQVLTKYRADFAILTTYKTLVFVEIEKPSSRILTKKGELHKDTQRAIDQIRTWRDVVRRDVRTLIDELGFDDADVEHVRFIAIAGRAQRENRKHYRSLRDGLPPDTSFYAFDELATILRQFESMVASL